MNPNRVSRYYNQNGYNDMKRNTLTLDNRKVLQGIYLGDRSTMFKTMLYNIFTKSKIKDEYINFLLCPKSLHEFDKAFTSDSVDPKNNYQVYEQLGDLTCNKFIGWYMYQRVPQLKCTEGVKIVARLKINYCGKNFFSKFAESLGFWTFISTTHEQKSVKKKSLLEDVFESFIGVTETLLEEIEEGIGYKEVRRILKMIFDGIDISLKYEDLYDPKTRLKELFDYHCDNLGELVYEDERISGNSQTKTVIYEVKNAKFATNKNGIINKSKIVGGQYNMIGQSVSSSRSSSQQQASEYALRLMKSRGVTKPELPIYAKMNSNTHSDQDQPSIKYSDLVKKWGIEEVDEHGHTQTVFDINGLYRTKMSSKYNSNYSGTLLSMFCEHRNLKGIKVCLSHNADVFVEDSNGLSPFDMIVKGNRDVVFVTKVFNMFIKSIQDKQRPLKLEKMIWEHYFVPFYHNASPEFSFDDVPIKVVDSYFNNNYRLKMMNTLRYVKIQCQEHVDHSHLENIERILLENVPSHVVDKGTLLKDMMTSNQIPGIVQVMDRINQSYKVVN